ncbi:MAG: hypothetical protein JXA62_02875 [Candidatus Aminicenantes bacterium]|nr:hypothetical protein [Candidatus Aminicenantes bacterium]
MMKRKITFIGIMMLVGLSLMAQTITITAPNGGESWAVGSNQTITWTTSGIASGQFRIILFDGDTNLGTIASYLPVTQNSFNWIVGNLTDAANVGAGSNYKIKIRIISEAPSDFSDAAFSITSDTPPPPPPPPDGAVSVTSPNGGEQWNKNSTQAIRWSASGISGGTYEITLWRGGANQGTVANGISAHQTSFNWNVGTLVGGGEAAPATGYIIKVRHQSGTAEDVSDRSFEIKPAFATGTLVPLIAADYEVESLDFRDFRGRNVFRVNETWEFPYNGSRTPGTALVRVRRHPGIQLGTCRPQIVVVFRVLSRGGSTQRNTYNLEFNPDNIAEVRAPFTVPEGLRADSDINIQAYLAPMPDGCDRVRTNNSKATNLNLHAVGGHDLSVLIDNFEVKKIYMSSSYRWRFIFRIGVEDQGVGELRNVHVRWRLLEDGTNPVYIDTLTIARLVPGTRQHLNIDRRFGGTDKKRSVRPRLKAGHRYVVAVMVDPDNEIEESRENNNQASRSVTLPD